MSSAVHKRSFWLVADTQDGFDQRPASPVSYCTAHPNWYLTSSSCQAQSKPDLRTTCIIFRTLHRECHVLGILSWAYFNDSSPGSRSVNLWYIISGPPPWNGECSPFPGMSPPPSPTYLTLMSFHPPRVCPALKQNSITHLTLAGEQSLSARTHALEGFQTNPTIEVFVVSIGVGGSTSTLHVQTECTSWWSTHDKVLHSSLNWQLSLQDTLGILRWFNKQWTVFIGSVKHKP